MGLPNVKVALSISVVSALVGAYITYKFLPPKEITKTEIQEIIKEHTVTQIHEVVRPDGSKETNTTIVGDSTESKHSTTTQTVVPAQKQWFASIGVAKTSITSDNIYQVNVNKRFLGPLYIGASFASGNVDNDKEVGLTVGMEF